MPEVINPIKSYLVLLGEVYQTHSEENALSLHGSSWKLFSQPEIATQFEKIAEDELRSQLLVSRLEEALHTLSSREQDVINRHFGLNGDSPLNLTQIGKSYGISREYTRRTEDKGLKKLGRNLESAGFRDFLTQDLGFSFDFVEKLYSLPHGVYYRHAYWATRGE